MQHMLAQNTETATERNRQALLRRGDRVTVRDSRGRILERRVWGTAERVVYLCTDRLFEALMKGLERTPPIGFPKSDVIASQPSG